MIEREVQWCPHTRITIQAENNDEMIDVLDHLMKTTERKEDGGLFMHPPEGFGLGHGMGYDKTILRKPTKGEKLVKEVTIFSWAKKN